MKILFRFGQELFWTMFWVFLVLIVGFALLGFLSSRNVPLSGWIASHASGPAS